MRFYLEFRGDYLLEFYDNIIPKLLKFRVETIWDDLQDPDVEDSIWASAYIVDIDSLEELDRLEKALGDDIHLYSKDHCAVVGYTPQEEDDGDYRYTWRLDDGLRRKYEKMLDNY